jgi:hypothetical protein
MESCILVFKRKIRFLWRQAMKKNSEHDKLGIPVSFRTIAHFFDPDDPTPEQGRELSDRAEHAISHAVLDSSDPLHAGSRCSLEIHLPPADLTAHRETTIPAATRSHFLLRADEIGRDMRLTQRVGIREFRLTVGVCIPAFLGIIVSDRFPHEPLAVLLQNILIVLIWVVIWQPFQSLVFDRWSDAELAKVYRQIARMDITVMPG